MERGLRNQPVAMKIATLLCGRSGDWSRPIVARMNDFLMTVMARNDFEKNGRGRIDLNSPQPVYGLHVLDDS